MPNVNVVPVPIESSVLFVIEPPDLEEEPFPISLIAGIVHIPPVEVKSPVPKVSTCVPKVKSKAPPVRVPPL